MTECDFFFSYQFTLTDLPTPKHLLKFVIGLKFKRVIGLESQSVEGYNIDLMLNTKSGHFLV